MFQARGSIAISGRRLRDIIIEFGKEHGIVFSTHEYLGNSQGGGASRCMNFEISRSGDAGTIVFYEDIGQSGLDKPAYTAIQMSERNGNPILEACVGFRGEGDDPELTDLFGDKFPAWFLRKFILKE